MPLTFLRPGETGVIRRVGGADDTKRFLANLGFVDGSRVSVVSELSGNMIVTVKDNGLRVLVTFLDLQNLSRYKAEIYEEEDLMNRFMKAYKEKKDYQQFLMMLQVFNTPNCREIRPPFSNAIS